MCTRKPSRHVPHASAATSRSPSNCWPLGFSGVGVDVASMVHNTCVWWSKSRLHGTVIRPALTWLSIFQVLNGSRKGSEGQGAARG